MSPQTAMCLNCSWRGSRLAGGERDTCVWWSPGFLAGSSARVLQATASQQCSVSIWFLWNETGITASQKSSHNTAQAAGEKHWKTHKSWIIRNILTRPVMTHIGKLWKKHISHPRKGGGVTGLKWCFPEPSRRVSQARPQAATSCLCSQPLQQPTSQAIKGLSPFPLCLCTVPSLPPSPKEDGHYGSMVPACPSYHHQCRLHWQRVG